MTTSPVTLRTIPLVQGLAFPESPRWHDGALWLSDMHAQRILSVSLAGEVTVHAELDRQPSGLGWQPDGTLWVVSMEDRRILEILPSGAREIADLSSAAPFHCNDMVVDAAGNAYVGNFGFDFEAHATPVPTHLLRVSPNGTVATVADDLWFPNGMVIGANGTTLVVAETMASRLTAFTIAADGSLCERRVWAELDGATADGICLDEEGAIWVASPTSAEVLRVAVGGTITHRVPVAEQAIACMLGGPARRTLFVLAAPIARAAKNRASRRGSIATVEVEVPAAGLP